MQQQTEQFNFFEIKNQLDEDIAEIKLDLLEILREKNPKEYFQFLSQLQNQNIFLKENQLNVEEKK